MDFTYLSLHVFTFFIYSSPMLTEVCHKIPFMGISDVMEIIKVIKTNSNAQFEECRPLKVIAFLKSEAKIITGQMAPNADLETVQGLVDFITQEKLDVCIHSKPLFYLIQ
jgi:hypothetical protein